MVKEIVSNLELAQAEVQRLNELNTDRQVTYFWQMTRLYPDGLSAGIQIEEEEKEKSMENYAHPEVLVETQWVAEHLDDPKIRIIDTHIDPAPYEAGHIPGAVFWNGFETLLKPDWRINFDKDSIEELFSRSGIANDTTVIAYSDHNALAPWVFWFLNSCSRTRRISRST